eukprot:SM000124S25937  [mRNA]  locus=s124:234197:235790:+ [translate_table: standard]
MTVLHDDGDGELPTIRMAAHEEFRIVKEDVLHTRYLSVFNRVVEFSNHHLSEGMHGKHMVEYDVVASRTRANHFCAVLPYHTATKSFTILQEYSQGANAMVYGVPCGGLSSKHGSLEDCVRQELSEEVFLRGGRLLQLIPDSHPGLLEVKWCKNRFTPFLVIDPEVDPSPRPRDAEEIIKVVSVDEHELRSLMYSGDMMLPAIVTCVMSLEKLQKHGLL